MSRLDPPVILVTGDVAVDWAILAPSIAAPELYASYRWEQPATVQISSSPGSAALIASMLSAILEGDATTSSSRVVGPTLPPEALTNPADTRTIRTFALWQEYRSRVAVNGSAWRMRQFLGLQPASGVVGPEAHACPECSCVIIDDANLGYRDRPDAWSSILQASARPRHIILKMSAPLGHGSLWDHLAHECSDVLTVYCSVGDLRKEYAPIGQPLSWERTASDVVGAVHAHPALRHVARVVVTLGFSGAVFVSPDQRHELIFDPLHQEEDWEREHPGSTPGLGTAMAAALGVECALNSGSPNWSDAIRRGLAIARSIHELGYTLTDNGLSAPAVPASAFVLDEPANFDSTQIPAQADWQISTAAFQGQERAAADRIVREGDEVACTNLPVERMGTWSSIDRTEIESMRSVRHIMREYLKQERPRRPLSLAVFGPPGSGKSFAIKQMAREWIASGSPIEVLEFNLSQLATGELPRALQRVRDCAVEQRLPLVFWDEFDTAVDGRTLGWLAQFLAPMQDGIFMEDGIGRPIGPAIFVFAGGTHATMASFKERSVELPAAKATDFLSRLRGFVDILGPNPASDQDRSFVLRRALLLRSLLKLKAPQLTSGGMLQIDPGVLRAFLDVTSYVHGARSMEAIIDMSTVSGRLRYERSALPPAHQLGLHVDAEEFLTLVRGTQERATPS